MKILFNIVLGVLVFLAVASGVTKVMLMEQDVEFFSQYGFTNPLLIVFGALQLMGGLLMIFNQFRIAGASLVAITFLISAVVLILASNWMVAGFTFVAIILLVVVILRTLKSESNQLNEPVN